MNVTEEGSGGRASCGHISQGDKLLASRVNNGCSTSFLLAPIAYA